MTIGFSDDAQGDDLHSRYVLFYPDAPTLVDIDTLIETINSDDQGERLPGIVALSADAGSEQVEVTREDDGTWVVKTLDGAVVEEIQYSDEDDVVHHRVFVDGFTTDQCPVFMVGVTDR